MSVHNHVYFPPYFSIVYVISYSIKSSQLCKFLFLFQFFPILGYFRSLLTFFARKAHFSGIIFSADNNYLWILFSIPWSFLIAIGFLSNKTALYLTSEEGKTSAEPNVFLSKAFLHKHAVCLSRFFDFYKRRWASLTQWKCKITDKSRPVSDHIKSFTQFDLK